MPGKFVNRAIRVRNAAIKQLIVDLSRDAMQSKSKFSPAELLKNGYIHPDIKQKYEDVKYHDKFISEITDNSPFKFSEVANYANWFAAYPDKIAGPIKVTTSMFFPLKVMATKEDVIKCIDAGMEGSKVKVESGKDKKDSIEINNGDFFINKTYASPNPNSLPEKVEVTNVNFNDKGHILLTDLSDDMVIGLQRSELIKFYDKVDKSKILKHSSDLRPIKVKKEDDKLTVIYTSAPESYDGFGTKTVEATNYITPGKGEPIRKVLIPEKAFSWQTQRYSSGMYAFYTESQFAVFSENGNIKYVKKEESNTDLDELELELEAEALLLLDLDIKTKPNQIGNIPEIGLTFKDNTSFDNKKIGSSTDAADAFRNFYSVEKIQLVETFSVGLINRAGKLIGISLLSTGGKAQSIVDVSFIVALAAKTNASSAIICHNHPSGSLSASDADKRITVQVGQALKLIDVRLTDHIILTKDNYFSFGDASLPLGGIKPYKQTDPVTRILTGYGNISGLYKIELKLLDDAFSDYPSKENAKDIIKLLKQPIYKTYNWANEGGDPEIYYYGFDEDDAKKELNTYNQVEEYEQRSQDVILEKSEPSFNQKQIDKFLEDAENLSDEDFESEYSDIETVAEFIKWNTDDFEFIDSITIPGVNESTNQLIYDVQNDLAGKLITEYEADGYNLKIRGYSDSKYNNIFVTSEIDGEEYDVQSIQLRIADHSYNPRNNDSDALDGNFISVVIANRNATAKKFHGKYNLEFDGDNDVDDVAEAVNERIEEIIDGWDIEEKLKKNNSTYAKALSGLKNKKVKFKIIKKRKKL